VDGSVIVIFLINIFIVNIIAGVNSLVKYLL
jgi:hypothetical protein